MTLPADILAEAVGHLPTEDLLTVELVSRAVRGVVRTRGAWRDAYRNQVRLAEWRLPSEPPPCWKAFFFQVRRERELAITPKIHNSSALVAWRVGLPSGPGSARRRSREFSFSEDALGEPIRWQIEVEVFRASGEPPPGEEQPAGASPGPQQGGLVRMWTTNQWTNDATRHYYGSHCTMSMRDSLGLRAAHPEQAVDIDNSQPYEFDLASLPPNREAVIHVHLTLALERAAPLNPFYARIADPDSGETDAIRIGYCKAVFEVARFKRKRGGIFVRECDRGIAGLVRIAGAADTSEELRVEVLQALFNLLGPTSPLLSDEVVSDLLCACFRCIEMTPAAPPPGQAVPAALLVQNALGAVFNLLVHPLSRKIGGAAQLRCVLRLLKDSAYAMCHFSVITVALTVYARGGLPPEMAGELRRECEGFMSANDPIDSDCTGVAWDESDVAAFFVPLLRSSELLCVRFATWCIAKYYFPMGLLSAPRHAPAALLAQVTA